MSFRRFARPGSRALLTPFLLLLTLPSCSDDPGDLAHDPMGTGSSTNRGDGGGAASGGAASQTGGEGDGQQDSRPVQAKSGPYSWDGSWSPSSFPVAGLLDETHEDLPPGKWGWDNGCDCPGDAGLAIYENEFLNRGLDFEPVKDASGELFGWRLVSTDGSPIELDARLDNFDGTPGVDIIDLLEDGNLNGTGRSAESPGINLGDGPDMLRFGTGWSLDLRTGDSERGAEADNDLVILGTNQTLPTGEYDIHGASIHTGPGADLVFTRNFGPAAIDLGNGQSGRTDSIDPTDGDDIAILQGNMRDFRIYGGGGDDVFVWYVDEVLDDEWLGPNFFGGGGWGDAVWAPAGTDRLILVVDPNTKIVSERSEHDDAPGSFLSFVYPDYEVSIDTPTEDDVFARYYGTVPLGPDAAHTVTVSYRSADESVFTHDFYLTSVEEIQLGLGEDAVVYDVDFQTGALTPSEAAAIAAVPDRESYEGLFSRFPE